MHKYSSNKFITLHRIVMTNFLSPDIVESLLEPKSYLLDDDLLLHLYVKTAVILIKYGNYTEEMLSMKTKDDLREGTLTLIDPSCSERLFLPNTSLTVKRKTI